MARRDGDAWSGWRGVSRGWLVLGAVVGLLAVAPPAIAQDATPVADPGTSAQPQPTAAPPAADPFDPPADDGDPAALAGEIDPEPESLTAEDDAAPEPTAPPNTDTLAGDTATVPLAPGDEASLAFFYAVTTPRRATTVVVDLRLPDGGPATGWRLNARAGAGDWVSGDASVAVTEYGALAPGTGFALAIVARPPDDLPSETTASLVVSSTVTTERGAIEPGLAGSAPVATLIVSPPAPPAIAAMDAPLAGAMMQATADTGAPSCVQVSTGDDVLAPGEYIVFRCDNPPSDLQPDDGFPSYYLKAPAITPGWRLSYRLSPVAPSGDPALVPDEWSAPTAEAVTAPKWGEANNVTAYLALGPDTAAAPGRGTVTIEFLQGRGYPEPGHPYPTPRAITLGATLADTSSLPCAPVIDAQALDFGTSSRTDAGYTPVRQELVLSIAPPGGGCEGMPDGWTIQVSASPLTGPGDTVIPASAIAFAGDEDGAPDGLVVVPESFPLGAAAQTIATGSARVPATTWRAAFILAPPGDAPPGAYAGTLTIDIGAADP